MPLHWLCRAMAVMTQFLFALQETVGCNSLPTTSQKNFVSNSSMTSIVTPTVSSSRVSFYLMIFKCSFTT